MSSIGASSGARGDLGPSRWLAALGAVAIALAVALGCTGTASASASVRAGGSYWGAWIGGQFTGTAAPWDMNAVSAFEKVTRKPLSTLNWSSPTYDQPDCGGYCAFQATEFNTIRAAGIIPFFSWNTGGARVTDAQVASGALDGYVTSWARAAKAWGHPFFLRFDWEMNGSWFPWGVGTNGNTTAYYVAMWRHVHDIFTAVGATNATWVWCPNIDQRNQFANLASLYPGGRYVDWTCLDGYNENNPWTSFADLFGSTYKTITEIAPSKPMIVGEVGSTATGGSKAQWITDMFNVLPTRFPQVHGLQWFEQNQAGNTGLTDWPIENSSSAGQAFSAAISRPAYQTSHYASLRTSPIPVPAATTTTAGHAKRHGKRTSVHRRAAR